MTPLTMSNVHVPIWLDVPMPDAVPLVRDATCDICVVGGGIAGILIAERLAREGLHVIVLEKGSFGHGETAHTSAHFTWALDDRYALLERMHGEEGVRLAVESHMRALDDLQALVQRTQTDCHWRRVDGYLIVNDHHAEKRADLLTEELAACKRAGAPVERVHALPLPWPGDWGAALRFPVQAQAHPLMLLRGVIEHLLNAGVELHAHTHATEIHGGDDATVETDSGAVVHCKHVVVATNSPVNNLVAVHTKQAGYQTYVMAFRMQRGALPAALLWDGPWEDDASYHYVRLLSGDGSAALGDDLLIVGGEDHKTGQGPDGEKPFTCIERWTRAHFPMAGAVERRWSGEVMEPADGLAYIGRNALDRDNVYIVTGDSGNGLTHAAVAARIIPDLIMKRDNPWAKLYDPARKIGWHALGGFLSENINTLRQYADWMRGSDVEDETALRPGEGGIIRKGLKHIAVYKDEHGACTHLNATCPHLGGVVRWNSQEKTWDCPCHASRFSRHGEVMHGPANADLKPADD